MVMVDETSCPQRRCNLCDKYRKELEEREKGCPYCLDEYDEKYKDLYAPVYDVLEDDIHAYIHYTTYGEPVLTIELEHSKIFPVEIGIYYCPICGRKLKKKGVLK